MLVKGFDAKTFDKDNDCCACGSKIAPHKCSTGQYCEEHKRNAAEVMRFVVTYVKRTPYKKNDGTDATWCERRLVGAKQGRNTHATREEGEKALAAVTGNNEDWRLAEIYGKDPDFKVIECPCWPVHFDPRKSIFDA